MTSNRIASGSPDNNSALAEAFDPSFSVEHDTASGAIAIKEGVVIIDGAAALAMTLGVPTAGLPCAGGDDGKKLTVVAKTAQAHTVTTPANGINGADHIATFAAAVGNGLTLVAYGGVWYATAQAGITLS